MQTQARELPSFPETGSPETAHERSHRLLLWVLKTGCTVTLSDVDLQRADVAACSAVINATDEDIRQAVSFRRHQILAELRIRRSFARQFAQQAACSVQSEARPNLGPMAPLSPAPLSPAPSAAVREPVDIAF